MIMSLHELTPENCVRGSHVHCRPAGSLRYTDLYEVGKIVKKFKITLTITKQNIIKKINLSIKQDRQKIPNCGQNCPLPY